MEDLRDNPFSLLFPSFHDAKTYQLSRQNKLIKHRDNSVSPKNMRDEQTVKDVQELNSYIEEIFLFTLNKFSVFGGSQQQLIHLSSLSEIIGKDRK